jgi:uncharacterized protein YcbK (DUF882 family)
MPGKKSARVKKSAAKVPDNRGGEIIYDPKTNSFHVDKGGKHRHKKIKI